MKRRALLALALLVTLAAVAAALRALTRDAPQFAVVTRKSLVVAVEATGLLEAEAADEIGPPAIPDVWEFKLAFLAPEGTDVKAGQPVVGFDTSPLDRDLEQERAKFEQASRELEKRSADLELERLDLALELARARADLRKTTLKVDVPAELQAARELAKARSEHDVSTREVGHLERRLEALDRRQRAELGQLEARKRLAAERVTTLERSIAAMRVVAPRAGTLVYRTNWRGEKKKVGDTVWRAEKVLAIPDLARLRGAVDVAEVDLGRVKVGQPVAIRLDAHPDRLFRGSLERIADSVGRASPNLPTKYAKALVKLSAIDRERMRPGMRFRAEIEVDRADGALVAPLAAFDSASGRPTARRERLLGVETVAPTLGRRNASEVEVLDGVAEGDRLRLDLGEEAP